MACAFFDNSSKECLLLESTLSTSNDGLMGRCAMGWMKTGSWESEIERNVIELRLATLRVILLRHPSLIIDSVVQSITNTSYGSIDKAR